MQPMYVAAECAAEIKAGIRKQMRAMRRALDAEAVREASFAVAEKVSTVIRNKKTQSAVFNAERERNALARSLCALNKRHRIKLVFCRHICHQKPCGIKLRQSPYLLKTVKDYDKN